MPRRCVWPAVAAELSPEDIGGRETRQRRAAHKPRAERILRQSYGIAPRVIAALCEPVAPPRAESHCPTGCAGGRSAAKAGLPAMATSAAMASIILFMIVFLRLGVGAIYTPLAACRLLHARHTDSDSRALSRPPRVRRPPIPQRSPLAIKDGSSAAEAPDRAGPSLPERCASHRLPVVPGCPGRGPNAAQSKGSGPGE
jgi:hypothetical protein